jgi:hypothetical protein
MPEVLQSWCPLIAILLLLLLIQCWLQLLKWKKWAASYKDWVKRNCQCGSPGGDPEPLEPGWP